MTVHACPRCGLEARCSHRTWPDRHPAAAVTVAIVVLAMVVAHPWLLAVVAAGGGVYAAVRRQQRRDALAARAEYEHRQIMSAAFRWGPMELAATPPNRPAAAAPPSQRAADHWSPTEPMRAGHR
ncbi:hypothetical protein MMAN_04420 [Mycobacterium mantenii]|uniref:Uncharacterized protein n=1 Tax=Mycobacterium mantenii TaxID=560555 RepID=A0ABM7JLF3_MYCNT|nr:hypothetical protein MMAN_04420 [Mycobacterium mantenii]